jgi:hypothetical protein
LSDPHGFGLRAEKPLYQSLDEAQKRRFGMAFRFAAARRHMAEARTHGAGRPNKLAERSLATSPRDSHGAGWSPPRRLDRHGLRASQLCSLRLEQVDLVHARLHVSVPKITFCNNGTGSAKSPQSILEFLSILNAMDSDFHLAVRPHLNATPTLSFQSNGRGCVQRSMTNVT